VDACLFTQQNESLQGEFGSFQALNQKVVLVQHALQSHGQGAVKIAEVLATLVALGF